MSDAAQLKPPTTLVRPPDRRGSFESVSKAGFHRVAYVEWGNPASNRVVLCIHGLTRQGRDFDPLAAELAARGWRVICPDLVGRGQSGRLRNPEEYALPQYVMDMTALIARTGVETVTIVGTSLGGLIGIVMAGQENTPVTRLVVNDIGPFLPWKALFRIGSDVMGSPASFPNFERAVAYYRRVLAPFGELSDEEWNHLVRHSGAHAADGTWHALCDPGIGRAFRPTFFYNLTLWNYWDAISCPTLLLRGAASDLLLPSTAAEMTHRGPHAHFVEFPNCGHAPALFARDQIDVVADFLDSD